MRLRSVMCVLEQSLCVYVRKILYTLLYDAYTVLITLIHIVIANHSQCRFLVVCDFLCLYVYIRRSIVIVCFFNVNFIRGYTHQFSQFLNNGSCIFLSVIVYLYVCGHLSKVHYHCDDVYILFSKFEVCWCFDGFCSLGETVRDRYSLRELENLPLRCRLGEFCGPTSSATMLSLAPCALVLCWVLRGLGTDF